MDCGSSYKIIHSQSHEQIPNVLFYYFSLSAARLHHAVRRFNTKAASSTRGLNAAQTSIADSVSPTRRRWVRRGPRRRAGGHERRHAPVTLAAMCGPLQWMVVSPRDHGGTGGGLREASRRSSSEAGVLQGSHPAQCSSRPAAERSHCVPRSSSPASSTIV